MKQERQKEINESQKNSRLFVGVWKTLSMRKQNRKVQIEHTVVRNLEPNYVIKVENGVYGILQISLQLLTKHQTSARRIGEVGGRSSEKRWN